MIIYKTDYITIDFQEHEQLLEVTWHGYAAGPDYRAALMQYVEALRNHKVKYWLGDYRLARVVRVSDQEWTMREWGPLFFPLSGQLEKMARVKSTDVAARISAENMFKDIDLQAIPFQFVEFDDFDEARAWLLG